MQVPAGKLYLHSDTTHKREFMSLWKTWSRSFSFKIIKDLDLMLLIKGHLSPYCFLLTCLFSFMQQNITQQRLLGVPQYLFSHSSLVTELPSFRWEHETRCSYVKNFHQMNLGQKSFIQLLGSALKGNEDALPSSFSHFR